MIELHPRQQRFVDHVWQAVAAEPLMRRGRGAGKSTAIRALIERLEKLESLDHEEARELLGLSPMKPGYIEHNHITRDIKERGKCPACDRHHDRQEKK